MRAALRWFAAGLVALMALAGAAGCGVPIDDAPEPLEVPPQYQATPTTTAPTQVASPGGLTAMLCLTRDGRLVQQTRSVDAQRSPQQLLADLIEGPTDAEAAEQSLSSALTGIRAITVAGTDQGIVEIAVGDLEGITTANQLLIFGQIVCTLDALDTVTGVRFSQNGQPLPVPRADATSADVVYADDYEMLLEASAPSTEP